MKLYLVSTYVRDRRRVCLSAVALVVLSFAFLPALFAQAVPPQAAPAWPADAPSFRVHMIGHGHIDPVWLWPWSEGLSVVHSTFRSALDRMKETPDFAMTASSAQFYQWVSENDPAMLAEIRKRVEEGRWGLVGGWWVEPDVNIPSGEAMARQGLYAQLTLRRLLGRTARTGFNPDSFGHTGTLPQILKLQGMENYVFMRPGPQEKTLPADVFWWEAPDGTRVLTYRILGGYGGSGAVSPRVLTGFHDEPVKSFMQFYGAGDHGGGPTRAAIQTIQQAQSQAGAPVVVFSTPDRYFDEIRKSASLNLPVVKDDLQHHSVGCYTADAAIKKGNRMAESALVTAEKVASIGSAVWGAAYPKAEFTSAWERVLFTQFHDSMAGTSLPEQSEAAREAHDYALDIAHQAMYKAAQRLAWQVPAEDPASQYLLVFNPHGWEITENLEYDLGWRNTSTSTRVEDERGTLIPSQWNLPSTEVNGRFRLVFRATVPAFGYRQIRVRREDATAAPATAPAVHAEGNVLENEHLRVRFTNDGTIGVLDKDTGKELFRGGETGARGLIINDPSDTWSHGVKAYTEEIGAFKNADMHVVENGPLRACIRVRSTYGASNLTTDWFLYAGARTLEARVALDWHEHQKMLKFSFPVDVSETRATYEVPYGYIVRKTNGDEDPGQRWIDVSGTRNGSEFGLTIINDAKYGYSVSDNDLRISIARGAAYANHQPKVLDPKIDHIWQDQGIQMFRMLLVPHRGTWQDSGIVRAAEEFMAAAAVIYQGIHPGSRPQADSFLAVNAPNVVISAIKKAENGDDLILRCYETAGTPASASIDLRFAKRQWSGKFRAFEIKTLRVNLQTGNIREVNLLEE